MAKLTLKDGSILEVENGVTFLDAAKKISEGLARNAVAVKVDGALKDLTAVVENDCAFEVLTFPTTKAKSLSSYRGARSRTGGKKHLSHGKTCNRSFHRKRFLLRLRFQNAHHSGRL